MTPDLREQRAYGINSWQYRAVEATRGNQSRLGCIVLAMIGKEPSHPPYFGSVATITPEGRVLADVWLRDWTVRRNHYIGMVHEVRDNIRGLADHLKLNDEDREAMLLELRRWMRDMRPEHASKIR